ncbi:MAG: HPP family protein [Gammaproteobacteria bacterium]
MTRFFLPGWAGPLLVASMGASSVLLFVVPASPMSRPWPLVGGHLSASLMGVSCAQYIPDQALAAALAVAGSILAMHFLRCLHPPGGAAALVAVVGGEPIQQLGYQFLLTPVALDVAIMLGVASLLQHLLRGRAEVHGLVAGQSLVEDELQRPHGVSASLDASFSHADLDAALRGLNTYIDVSREDLHRIYDLALLHARTRSLDGLRASDGMRHEACAVEFAIPLDELWQMLQRKKQRGAVVVSSAGHVLGMVTISDFMRHANELEHENLSERLRHLMTPSGTLESDKPEVAGQIMSRPVITTRPQQRLAELVPVFANQRIHHLPVVDERDRLTGMLVWEDVLALAEKNSNTKDTR